MIVFILLLAGFSVFAAQKLPSVGDIDAYSKSKFDIQIYKCLVNRSDLVQLYKVQSVKAYIEKKYKNSVDCSQVIPQLEKISDVQKTMIDISNRLECSDEAYSKTISLDDAKVIQNSMTAMYNKIAGEYSQFFTYDAVLTNVESCINYYDDVTVAENINMEAQRKIAVMNQAQAITAQYNLVGVYGDESGAKGLVAVISEIENGNITMKEISQYSILESTANIWVLVGAFDRNLIYSSGTVYVAIPMIQGISYSGDALPYNLFQLQKKIDIKKSRYSIYILKPLI